MAEEALKTTPATADQPTQTRTTNPKWIWGVWIGLILTIIAWICMPFSEHLSLCGAILALVVSILSAIFVGRGGWRDTAVTAAVASGALVLVYIIFYSAISLVFKSL